MTSKRVKQMLEEIARLSDEEQAELLHGLPQRLHGAAVPARLAMDALRQAVDVRERIRRRLESAGQSSGSIDADLDEVREGRLAELLDREVVPERPL